MKMCCGVKNLTKYRAKFLELIEQLQPKPEYLRLFRAIVLDVWKKRQSEATKLAVTLQSRVD